MIATAAVSLSGAALAAVAVAVGVAVFLAVTAFTERSARQRLTRIQRAELTAAEQGAVLERKYPIERVRALLEKRGYRGDPTIVLASTAVVYFGVLLLAREAGVSEFVAVVFGLPLTLAIVNLYFVRRRAKQSDEVLFQLTQFLDQLHDQLSAGTSVIQSFKQVVPSLPNPLRDEMNVVLSAAEVDNSLVEPLRRFAERYPSNGSTLLVSAVEMDEERGARIDGAVKLAGDLLRSNRNLIEEANAELSQSKMQFYGVSVGVAAIAVWQVATAGGLALFASPGIAFAMLVLLGNYVIGIIRIARYFTRLSKI